MSSAPGNWVDLAAVDQPRDATSLENATHDENIPNMIALLDTGAYINAWSGGDVCCQGTALAFACSVPAKVADANETE